MLDTHLGVSGYTGYTVYPPQFWIHTDTHPGYTGDVARWSAGGPCRGRRRAKVKVDVYPKISISILADPPRAHENGHFQRQNRQHFLRGGSAPRPAPPEML